MDQHVDLLLRGRPQQGPSRRGFLKALAAIGAVLALPEESMSVFAQALAQAPKLPVLWLEFQDCTGDTESFLRGGGRADPIRSGVQDPGIIDLLLNVISLEYHETLMAPSGLHAEKSRVDVIAKQKGKYLAIVEGAIPLGAGGGYCMIGGRSAASLAEEVCGNARWTIACGSCAVSGCLPAAAPNPTVARGVLEAFPKMPNVINMPGCPMNVVNLTATICYLIARQAVPSLDSSRRPTFAYGRTVHDRCPREERYEDGPWVTAWGDSAHRRGGCLVRMGCRGPRTKANCPSVQWNGGVCWPVASGHGCIGCTEPKFWDKSFPYYSKPLPVEDD